jgi:hypothetical protein
LPALSIPAAPAESHQMTTTDPRDIIAKESMSRLQWAVVALTIALNALDGFDVLSISFASPGIARSGASIAPRLASCCRWN